VRKEKSRQKRFAHQQFTSDSLRRAQHLPFSRLPTYVNTILVYLDVFSINPTRLWIPLPLAVANCSAKLVGSSSLVGLIGLKRKVLGRKILEQAVVRDLKPEIESLWISCKYDVDQRSVMEVFETETVTAW